MDISLQKQKAEELRALHHASRILVLPNVWDAVSARIVETAGAKAIATSSAAIAFAYGYPDGEHISRKEMLEAVARIARVVSLPVTADMEAGYADSQPEIEQLAHELIATGAVGIFRHFRNLNCFPPDTLVGTESGLRPIGQVEAGERVWLGSPAARTLATS